MRTTALYQGGGGGGILYPVGSLLRGDVSVQWGLCPGEGVSVQGRGSLSMGSL